MFIYLKFLGIGNWVMWFCVICNVNKFLWGDMEWKSDFIILYLLRIDEEFDF